MPKMTKKYSGALLVLARHPEFPSDVAGDQALLYQVLQERGYFWDSGVGEWQYTAPQAADPPTRLIRVRVWAESSRVEQAASDVITHFTDDGYTPKERSPPYLCRPPKQAESRVYLTFLPPR